MAVSHVSSETVTKASKEQIAKFDDSKQTEVFNMLGNSILLIGFSVAEAPLEGNFALSLVNGMFCEVNDQLDAKVKSLYTPSYTRTADEKAVDCSKTPPAPANAKDLKAIAAQNMYACFCGAGKTTSLVFCTFSTLKKTLEGHISSRPCLSAASADLEKIAPVLYKEVYALDSFGSDQQQKNFDAEFSGATVDQVMHGDETKYATLFCEARHPKVYEAVKGLYAADASYWLAESILTALVFGVDDKDWCKDADFIAHPYGACVCKLETGYTFCIYKVIGEWLKDSGYIECSYNEAPTVDAPKAVKESKVEPTKKSEAQTKLKPLPHKGSASTSGSAAASAAATSTLLLAPAATAAALLLLLRH